MVAGGVMIRRGEVLIMVAGGVMIRRGEVGAANAAMYRSNNLVPMMLGPNVGLIFHQN